MLPAAVASGMRAGGRSAGELRGRALWVVLGCLVCQLGLGWGYALNPLAPDVLGEFGWSRAAFSSARAPQLAAMALASPLVGLAAVRFGARPVVALSVALLGLAFAGLAAMQSLGQYLGASLLLGLALTGLGDVAIGAVVAQWVSRARGLALGLVYTGSNLGGMLVTPLAAWLALGWGWRGALLALGALGVALMLPAALLAVREPRPEELAPPPEGSARPTPSGDGDLPLTAALRTRSFWALAFALFACFFFHIGTTDHLVLFLTDEGFSKVEASGWLGTAIGLGVLSKVAFGLVADRLHPKTAMLANTALFAASAGLTLLLPQRWALWAFTVVFGFTAAARDVTYPLLVAWSFGVRYLAQVYGALMVLLLPGGILGPIFAGWVHDRVGGYRPAFATFAVLNGLALLALAATRDERGDRTRIQPRDTGASPRSQDGSSDSFRAPAGRR